MAKKATPAPAAPATIQTVARRVAGRPFAIGPLSSIDGLVDRVLREGVNFTAGDPRDVGVRGGYPQINVGQDHKALLNFVRLAYKRSAPARVLVDRVADEEWGEWFELVGGREGFRLAVEAFMKRPTNRVGERPLWWWFKRAARLARRDGRSLLHFGLISEADPDKAPTNVKGVSYLQIITQDRIVDKEVGEDPSVPEEFGQVLAWKVTVDPGDEATGAAPNEEWIHADRVIPFIPDPSEDDIWEGDSLLATNVNYVEAVENMVWSALQAYSREAEPVVIVYRDGAGPTTEPQKAAVKRELRKTLEENTERIAFVHGIRAEVLESSTALANPTPHWDIAIQAYSMATGIPRPILTGEQIGELVAATEASKRWSSVISRLQETNDDPIVNVLLHHLEAWGVEAWAQLPTKDAVEIRWNPLREEDPGAEATRQEALAKTRAIYLDRHVLPPAALDYEVTSDPDMLAAVESAVRPAGGFDSPRQLTEADGPPEVAGARKRFQARLVRVFRRSFTRLAASEAKATVRVEATARRRVKVTREANVEVLFTAQDQDDLREAILQGLLDSANLGLTSTLEAIDAEGYHRLLAGGPAVFQGVAGQVSHDVAARLTDDARRIVAERLAEGSSPAAIRDALMERFEASRSDAERIARTESIRGFNEGAKEAMRAVGITAMRFEAFPDADAQCLELNGRTFNVEDLGASPPIHPNCRCALVAADEGPGTVRLEGVTLDGRVLLRARRKA